MVIIGIDPHKGSHTAVAIDEAERKLGEVRVRADRYQLEGSLKWAIEFLERALGDRVRQRAGEGCCPSSLWRPARRRRQEVCGRVESCGEES